MIHRHNRRSGAGLGAGPFSQFFWIAPDAEGVGGKREPRRRLAGMDDFIADKDSMSRYEPVLDPCGTWFVFDLLRGLPAEIGTLTLVGMSRRDAFLLATMLEGGRVDIEPDSTRWDGNEVERDNYRSKLARVPVPPFRRGR